MDEEFKALLVQLIEEQRKATEAILELAASVSELASSMMAEEIMEIEPNEANKYGGLDNVPPHRD